MRGVVSSQKRTARIAGLWYLAMALSAPIGIIYVPSQIVVAGDGRGTLAHIVAHEQLLRVGIVSSLFCQVCFVFLALTLSRLFQGVNDARSRLMVSLVITAVPIAIANELCRLAALEFGGGAGYLTPLSPEQRGALALALLNVWQLGIAMVGILWGLWLLPFGLLAIQSGLVPRILGLLLIVSCFSYLIDSSVALLAPQFRSAMSNLLMLPLAVGEVSMVLWLLIKGTRNSENPPARQPS